MGHITTYVMIRLHYLINPLLKIIFVCLFLNIFYPKPYFCSVCSDPPAVNPDATSQPSITSSSVFMIGDVIRYVCDLPAFDFPNSVVTCQADGLWLPGSVGECTQVG